MESFYASNGYLEYEAVSRVGISDPQTYIKKKYGQEVVYLGSCCVGQSLVEQIQAAVDDALGSGEF